MNFWLQFFLYLVLAAWLGIVFLVGRQFLAWRRGVIAPAALNLARVRHQRLQDFINQGYDAFTQFFIQVGHYTAVASLLAVRRAAISFKFFSIWLERRFSRLIDSVRGRGIITKKGAVSQALARLKTE